MKSRNLTINPDEGLITQPNKKMKPRALIIMPQKRLIKQLNKIKPTAFTIMLDKGLIKKTQ